MGRRLILPPPPDMYKAENERIRNREIELTFKSLNEKIAELETRIKALEP